MLSLRMGGQERLVLRLAQLLHDRGYDSHVITLTPGGELRSQLGGVPVHDVCRRDGFDPTLYPKLWSILRSLRPDVVHTHNSAPLIYGAPAAWAARTGVIVHTKHGDARLGWRALALARAATPFVDSFVAVSTETASAAKRTERPAADRLTVIENGIPLGAFRPNPLARGEVRDELGIPRDAKVVGSVGRLVPEKDYPLLVRAMAPLLGPAVRLVLVGEGGARPEIEGAIASELAADRRRFVILTGARHDVPRVLSAFDVFASSSRTEGLPLALPEAMTSGLPIVATSVGGVPDVVPRQAGILVEHGDVAGMRRAIARLLEQPGERTCMGKAGRMHATRRFPEERMLAEYVALYTAPQGNGRSLGREAAGGAHRPLKELCSDRARTVSGSGQEPSAA